MGTLMALMLRPTNLASTAYARLRDWAIVEDGRTVGRIVKDGSASTPPDRRWSWSMVMFVPRPDRHRDKQQGADAVGGQG